MDKEWYTVRYKFTPEGEWRYHAMNTGSFKLWSKGHAERIFRDYYGGTIIAEIVEVHVI